MTYHSKEVLDAAGVDGVQRGDLDAQQRVFGSERHDGGSESLVVCRVWRERLVLVYADRRCVGWYAGGLVLLWLRYGRMEVAEVSVTSARAWVEGCIVLEELFEWRVLLKSRCCVVLSGFGGGSSRYCWLWWW